MSKRLAEDLCAAWTSRTGIATIVLRAVMILADESLDCVTREEVELGAFVHVNDVGAATVLALAADLHGHVRLTLCGRESSTPPRLPASSAGAPYAPGPTSHVRGRLQTGGRGVRPGDLGHLPGGGV